MSVPPLQTAVNLGLVDRVHELISNGANFLKKYMYVYNTDGPGGQLCTPLMIAILNENLDMIDALIEFGERINHVRDGSDAVDFSIDNQKWTSLAHLIRIGGYPVSKYGDKSHLEIATDMGYYEGVSILQQEKDTPGFWRRVENLRYGRVHMEMARLLAKPADTSIKTPKEQWDHDRKEYESFAPSWRYLCEMGWYEETEESQRETVYSKHTKIFVDQKKSERKYKRSRTDV